MTPSTANLLGLLLIVCGAVGLTAAAVALLDVWQLLGVTSAIAVAGGVRLARVDGGVA